MDMSEPETYDLFVIGGGINGCGIARDAAGRGYSVYLAEMNDLASGTSSSSTKLIHGGLRYLEHYEFRLVREALMERETLWHMAPHIIWPMRFVLPHHRGLRPAWLLRLGLFLYDHLGGRKLLPATRVLNMRRDAAAEPLKSDFSRAFEYSDCWVNDARFVVLNARDAADRGADIHTRTRVTSAKRADDGWLITVFDAATDSSKTVRARLLVNAAGPWVDAILSGVTHSSNAKNVRLVKGSHIVVPRKFTDPRAYFFQNTDGRIFFAIPYENDFTLIGTTDEDFDGDANDVQISQAETDYLCESASAYFSKPVKPSDVVWSYSGVRPLYDDGASAAQEATRDYVLVGEGEDTEGLLINIFGGKITTYRKLAEAVLHKIEHRLGKRSKPWTAGSTLPGGDFPPMEFDARVDALMKRHPFLDADHARRLMRLYGTRAETILGKAKSIEKMGLCFGGDLYAAEVDYLIAHEWAKTADDIIWRRTKCGLKLDAGQVHVLADYMNSRAKEAAA